MAKYKIIPSSRTIVQSPISIGHKAEKGVEAIEFDVTVWVETYGSGTLTVIMRRWGDAIPYPIALEIDENNKATWTLSNTDTAKAGMAYAQLSYIVGDEVVKKSDIYTFRVMDSLAGEGEPPEAYESWLEQLTHLAAEAMAEVLDIEGIVTDKTLTVDGGIADGKATGDELSALKADLDAQVESINESLGGLDDSIRNGYKNVMLEWEHGWVNSSGVYDPNSNRYLIEAKSTSESTIVANNSESTIYVTYFSAYTDLTDFTYDSFVTVSKNKTVSIDKTKAYFLVESTATTVAGLNGVSLRNESLISYLSKNEIDSREQHKQNIYFAYCSDIFWSISGNDCSLRVNSNIRVRFDTTGTAVDTTPEQLLSIAQASSAGVTAADGIITGKHFAVVFDFTTNAIKIVDPTKSETYINTAILFYWFWGALGGFLVDNKTALAVTNMDDSIADYFVTEAQTCRDELIADCGEKAFVVAFTTDNHYGVSNGMNFPTTVKTIKKVNEMYKFDIVVDGGDLINGDKPKADAINLLTGAVNDLIEIGRPTYTLLGNHDDDSYTSSAQPLFSKAELYAMMHRHSGFDLDYIAEDAQYGYKDFEQYGLRIIILDAIYGANGHSSADWGYSDAELAWFTNDALNTDNQVVMFSHMAFTADYIAYGSNVKNGAAMRTAVENFIANGGVVVGLFHGHNHWDYIGQYSQTNGFHEVSTGCGRVESGPTISTAHPEGAVKPERTANTVTQELWDIIVIKPESRAVNIVRFGAGDNRSFTY